MSVRNTNWLLAAVVGAAVVALGAPRSHAVGTAAATQVNNRATVTFNTGGPTETVESSPTGNSLTGVGNGTDTVFAVDHMVDLTVAEADTTYTLVMPSDLQQALGYNVANTGNESQDIELGVVNLPAGPDPFGGNDSFDIATGVTYYLDVDDDDVFEPGGDDGAAITHIDALAADTSVHLWVVYDIPAGVSPGEVAGIILTATARTDDGAGTLGPAMTPDADGQDPDPLVVEILFADGAGDTDAANDAAFSDTDAYLVEAELTVTKTSAVVEDPVRGTTNPLAIPGAFLEYTITVDNGSASTATAITLTDQVATAALASFRADSYVVGSGIRYRVDPDGPGATPFGAYVNITNVGGDDAGDFGATTADTVTLTVPDLPPTAVAEVQFQVVIQ